MMGRVTFFAAGVAAGAVGSAYARRKVKAAAARVAPGNVARTTVQRARTRADDLVDAVREGRAAMRAREAELRTRYQGGPRTEPGAPVAGPVAQVIVLREVREVPVRPRRRRRRASGT